MKCLKYISPLFCLLLFQKAGAQDTLKKPSTVLPEFILVEKHAAISKKIYSEYEFDSIQLALNASGSLRDLLSTQSNIYLKSQSGAGLSTISMNGGNANHTAILFNGFNLQSPVTGQADLSLIPVFFMDQASVQNGGSSGNWGSGALGGSIQLNSDKQMFEGLGAEYLGSISSLKNYFNGIKIETGKGKTVFRTKIFQRNDKNYFSFQDPFTDEKKYQESLFKQWGVLQESKIRFNSRNSISSDIWFVDSKRKFASGMLQEKNHSGQEDLSLRSLIKYEHRLNNLSLQIRNSISSEDLYYYDSIAAIYSDLNFITNLAEVETFYSHNFLKINSGISHQYIKALNDGYENKARQNRIAVFSAFEWRGKKAGRLIIAGNVRQEITDGKFIPTVGTLGFQFKTLKWLLVRGGVSKNYRLPTLNDLYWRNGGNPDLLPESSVEQNGGLIAEFNKKISLRYELNAYNRNTTNWIIWLPSGNGVWSPQNILEVHSRGFSHRADLNYKYNKLKFNAQALWSYTVATNEKAANENDNSVGKLLIYTPIYQGQSKLMMGWKNNFIQYNYHYTGYRYTASDNTKFIAPYHLHDLSIGTRIDHKKINFGFTFMLNNIFNTAYQTVVWQAMPGRNYQLQLSIQFLNKNK